MRPPLAPPTLTSRALTHRCHSHYDMMKDSATADGTSMKPVPVARDGARNRFLRFPAVSGRISTACCAGNCLFVAVARLTEKKLQNITTDRKGDPFRDEDKTLLSDAQSALRSKVVEHYRSDRVRPTAVCAESIPIPLPQCNCGRCAGKVGGLDRRGRFGGREAARQRRGQRPRVSAASVIECDRVLCECCSFTSLRVLLTQPGCRRLPWA